MVVEGRDGGDDAEGGRAGQHCLVPRAQLGGRHRPAVVRRVGRLGVEDVICAGLGRRHPQVRVEEAAASDMGEVAHERRVEERRARGRRPHPAHRVQVRDVDAILVRRRRVGAVLLGVEAQEADVMVFNRLEEEEDAGDVREGALHRATVALLQQHRWERHAPARGLTNGNRPLD